MIATQLKQYKIYQAGANDLEALIFIYDEALKAITQAKKNLLENNDEDFKEDTQRVIKIVEGLGSILDFQRNPQLASNLLSLYGYIKQRLEIAKLKIRQSPAFLEESEKILCGLRESWNKVKNQLMLSEAAPAAVV